MFIQQQTNSCQKNFSPKKRKNLLKRATTRNIFCPSNFESSSRNSNVIVHHYRKQLRNFFLVNSLQLLQPLWTMSCGLLWAVVSSRAILATTYDHCGPALNVSRADTILKLLPKRATTAREHSIAWLKFVAWIPAINSTKSSSGCLFHARTHFFPRWNTGSYTGKRFDKYTKGCQKCFYYTLCILYGGFTRWITNEKPWEIIECRNETTGGP